MKTIYLLLKNNDGDFIRPRGLIFGIDYTDIKNSEELRNMGVLVGKISHCYEQRSLIQDDNLKCIEFQSVNDSRGWKFWKPIPNKDASGRLRVGSFFSWEPEFAAILPNQYNMFLDMVLGKHAQKFKVHSNTKKRTFNEEYIEQNNFRKAEQKKHGKYYFFNHLVPQDSSHVDYYERTDIQKSFCSAGLVEEIFNFDKNYSSCKDFVGVYLDPFDGYVESSWFSYDETDLFEVSEDAYNLLKTFYFKLKSIK